MLLIFTFTVKAAVDIDKPINQSEQSGSGQTRC